jgi:hypothetical protein
VKGAKRWLRREFNLKGELVLALLPTVVILTVPAISSDWETELSCLKAVRGRAGTLSAALTGIIACDPAL